MSEWLKLVGSIGRCVLCGDSPIQVAHRNQGKGMGMKCKDWQTAALCAKCHYYIDNGNILSLNERRATMDNAIIKTWDILINEGKIGIIKCGKK